MTEDVVEAVRAAIEGAVGMHLADVSETGYESCLDRAAQAALSAARPFIRNEAFEEAEQRAKTTAMCEVLGTYQQGADAVAAAIHSLKDSDDG